jgi:hypothetical protein
MPGGVTLGEGGGTRVPAIAASFVLACACVTVLPPFQPADPAQAIPNEPDAAAGTVAGVRITVRPGSWTGWPYDLEEHLTPVEIVIENGSGRPLEVRPHLFGLVVPNGFRHDALDAQAMRRRFAPAPPSVAFHYGFYGVYPWPGFYRPWTRYYPYMWWGFLPGEVYPLPPYAYYRPPLPAPAETALDGTLENGGHVSLLLFFPVPATSLQALSFDARLVDASGQPIGNLRVPFVRKDGANRPVR